MDLPTYLISILARKSVKTDMHNLTVNCTEATVVNYPPTNDSAVCVELHENMQIISQVFSSVVGVLAVFTVVTLTHHFLQERKALALKKVGSSLGRNSVQYGEKLFISMISFLTINAGLAIAVRCGIDLVVLDKSFRNRQYVVLTNIEIILNIASLSSIYMVLWIRQWMFYNHPATKGLRLEKLRVVCWLLVVVMVITGILNAIGFMSQRNLDFNEKQGCFVKIESHWNIIKFYSLAACELLYQIVLLGLFADPLIRHARSNTAKLSSKKKLMFRVLLRVFVAALICCVTDLLAAVISVIMESRYPESSFLIYNINLFINYACLLYTFGDWRKRLSSPCSVCREEKSSFSSTVIDSNGTSIVWYPRQNAWKSFRHCPIDKIRYSPNYCSCRTKPR